MMEQEERDYCKGHPHRATCPVCSSGKCKHPMAPVTAPVTEPTVLDIKKLNADYEDAEYEERKAMRVGQEKL